MVESLLSECLNPRESSTPATIGSKATHRNNGLVGPSIRPESHVKRRAPVTAKVSAYSVSISSTRV